MNYSLSKTVSTKTEHYTLHEGIYCRAVALALARWTNKHATEVYISCCSKCLTGTALSSLSCDEDGRISPLHAAQTLRNRVIVYILSVLWYIYTPCFIGCRILLIFPDF